MELHLLQDQSDIVRLPFLAFFFSFLLFNFGVQRNG